MFEVSPLLLFAEKAAWGAAVAVAVGRRVLGVIVVVVGAGQDGAYATGPDWKKKEESVLGNSFVCSQYDSCSSMRSILKLNL